MPTIREAQVEASKRNAVASIDSANTAEVKRQHRTDRERELAEKTLAAARSRSCSGRRRRTIGAGSFLLCALRLALDHRALFIGSVEKRAGLLQHPISPLHPLFAAHFRIVFLRVLFRRLLPRLDELCAAVLVPLWELVEDYRTAEGLAL